MGPIRKLILLCASLLATAAGAADTYVFGVTPQFERRQLFAIWTPILAELQKRTGYAFELAAAANIKEFEHRYNSGAFDFSYMNPYLVVENPQGYLPLVRDATPIRGIVVVRRDSNIRGPADLNGAEIAFPAPNAIGASLLIRAELARKYHVAFTPRYVQSHTAVYLSVAQGLAAAGGGVQKTFDEQKDAVRDLLRVVHTTPAVPSLPIAAHPRVPPKVREAVRAALLAMAATPEGAALLADVPISRMVGTSQADYEPLRELGLRDFFVAEP